MTQASIMSEFRSAYEIGKSKQVQELADNSVLEVINSFGDDKRVTHFFEDITFAIQNAGDSLAEAENLSISIAALDTLVERINKVKTSMSERRTEIITRKAEAGITHEGPFEIYPVTSKTNRTPDIEKIKKEAPGKWDILLDLKIEEVKESYKPNQTALKAVFGKGFDKYLIPGSETITGYDIRLIDQMPEKGSVEVEP